MNEQDLGGTFVRFGLVKIKILFSHAPDKKNLEILFKLYISCIHNGFLIWLLYVVHYKTVSPFNTAAKKSMPRKMIII